MNDYMKNNEDKIYCVIEEVKSSFPDIIYKLNEPLKNHTSFKIGGPVRVMFFPENVELLTDLCGMLNKYEIDPLIMGNGTNILAVDAPLDLTVINMSKICNINLSGPDVTEASGYRDITVEAGAMLSKAAVFAYENNLSGLEFAHGIPGTAGGAVVMNAGAYGGEMKDIVQITNVYNIKTGNRSYNNKEQKFTYRQSRFSNTGDIVLSSVIRLQKCDKEIIKSKMDELSGRRRYSQPLDLPSGGSTFKRPKEGYAAALIEQSGLKGYSVGGAQVSQKHAGFIVNYKDATFSDVMAVINHVRETVYKKFTIELELELKIVK